MRVPEVGELIDRYRLDRLLGEGGMGVVFKATHVALGRPVALKFLRPPPGLDEDGERDLLARLLTEGRILSQLNHPGLARVTDVVAHDGLAALVMDYYDAPTLEQVLAERETPFTLDEIRDVALPLLDALDYAHSRGVIHRDLKPANVLIQRRADGRVEPVILDFGIAKLNNPEEFQDARRTAMAMRLGTLGYMSPEQVRRQPVDARADVFAAGAILYEMAALRPAFDGSSEYEIMERIVSGEFEELPPVPGDTSGVLAKALLLALAPDPHDRLPSAAALADALRAPAAAPIEPPPALETPDAPELELDAAPAPAVIPAPARARSTRWFLWLLLLIGAVGAWVTYNKVSQQLAAQAAANAERAADDAEAALRRHKTDADVNSDPAYLDAARQSAEAALAAHATPRLAGLHALLLVQAQRWHYAGQYFDELTFAEADRVTLDALQLGETPEALLARALLTSNACTMLPEDDARQPGLCQEAEARYREVNSTFRIDPRGWLRMEVWWTEVMFYNRLASARTDAGDAVGARRYADTGLKICQMGIHDWDEGPVNNVELGQECLAAASIAQDYRAYLTWAERRIRHDLKTGAIRDGTLKEIYRFGHRECSDLKLDKDKVSGVLSPRPDPNKTKQVFCAALGYYSLGCVLEGRRMTTQGTFRDPTLPWLGLATAAELHNNRPSCPYVAR
ncbi:MAG: serine/threonine protein kinase [Deltaproteobacteria bacterium]|nr:serine/threonine protein kinase [Deltaproteobacteria bacterium]